MTRRPLGSRTLASLPAVCVCAGERRMQLVSVQGMRATGVIACPHCSPANGEHSIEIRTYRMRDETPKDVA